MRDPNAAIQALYNSLIIKGIDPDEATDMCHEAAVELSAAIATIVTDGLNEAYEVGERHEAEDFVDKLDIRRNTLGFDIGDSSIGIEHRPRLPMLPILLKNGKLSQRRGTIYKFIPKYPDNTKRKKVELTSMATMQNRSELIEKERQALREKRKEIPDVMSITERLGTMIGKPKLEITHEKPTGTPERYFTASSSQDPDSKWVRPAKTIDVRDDLNRINTMISSQIEAAVEEIIRRYGG